MRALVIEDSERLRQSIRLALRKHDFVVDAAGDGEEGLWLARTVDYEAIVLDLMLPKLDGLTVLRRLRQHEIQTPVLILTAKGAVADRVEGLHSGADDYLTKPFALEELIARVGALVRRKYGQRNPLIKIGDLEINTASKKVSRAGEPIDLTPREYRLLELFAHRQGQIMSHAQLEERLYAGETEILSNAVESTVSSLRRKLDQPGRPSLIQTRRGLGYLLAHV